MRANMKIREFKNMLPLFDEWKCDFISHESISLWKPQ